MRSFARRSGQDRRDLFRAAAQAMQVQEAIIEKDFWVCWVLDYLFQSSPWKDKLAFKGGTSLSKAYHAIERFSEDIDLVLDWRLLGYSADDPWQERSATRQNEFNMEANQRCATFLAREFIPVISQSLKELAAAEIGVEAKEQDVLIQYPHSFSLSAILPQIKLEIGPLAAWIPKEEKEIRPYAAEKFPHLFSQPSTAVSTVTAERTFWEKATILHQEAHRPPAIRLPSRYSRHYYDLYRLSRSPIRDMALAQLDLLQKVVDFKMKFYRSAWAKYEEARPGSLRLLPPAERVADLRKDYQSMQPMLFGTIPGFEDVLTELAALEKMVNNNNLKVKPT
ncbi:MAG: nucleotidyl transferase AbiEii/AbiGii toxin family protein [Chloroflexi bacterium]|nr:nucleotidyl transferase AbiEii/AbiGii toxin family protein [Chloroflexota bacterium]